MYAQKIEEVKLNETVEVNGRRFAGPGCVWRESFVREISFCPLGADAGTSIKKADAANRLAASAGTSTTEILRGANMYDDKSPDDIIVEKAREIMAKDGVSFTHAVHMVCRRFPDLVEAYLNR